MKHQHRSYQQIFINGIAALFLLLFIGTFVLQSLSHNVNELYKSELVDFEGDTDSEEDSKNEKEKEKEDKLLNEIGMLLSENTQRIYRGHIFEAGPNEEIEEVLSPPPEFF